VNSRLARETAEFVRAQKGDGEAGAFATTFRARLSPNTPISRDARSSSQLLNALASAAEAETAWQGRRFSPSVDAFMEEGRKVGVRGIPAWGG